jgi:LCP family protein required for cell wall assembly
VTTETTSPWAAGPSTGRTVAVVALAFVVGLAVVAGAYVWWVDRSVERVGVDGLGEGGLGGGSDEGTEDDVSIHGNGDVDPDALTVLVLGSDSRDVLSPQERAELGTGYAAGERTEVMALTRLDPAAGEVRILSIPRDSLVRRCDGSEGRANAAYAIGERQREGGGASCVVETLRSWLGVRIDHVVKVDFRGFVDIVDALGGVSMHLDEPLRDRRANLDLDAGCQRLDGADALAFVRARRIDDDYGRMERQHRLVTELRDELADQGVLGDLPRLLRVAEATARAVELDDTLTIGRIQQLVREHRRTIRGEIDGRSIPGEIERIDGIAFLRLDEQRTDELARWLVTGRDVAEIRDELLESREGDGSERATGAGEDADASSGDDGAVDDGSVDEGAGSGDDGTGTDAGSGSSPAEERPAGDGC